MKRNQPNDEDIQKFTEERLPKIIARLQKQKKLPSNTSYENMVKSQKGYDSDTI